jgi:V-type H+-transporting ATPase subunit a
LCQIWNIFFSGRYIILLMGLFSVYTGVIYNDIFSRSVNIFGSSWKIDGYTTEDIMTNAELTLSPYSNFAKFEATPYPLGLDPVWQVVSLLWLSTAIFIPGTIVEHDKEGLNLRR